MTEFQKELLSLLNRHSKENESNTPDFILAEYLVGCLKIFNESVENRRIWYANEKHTTPEAKKEATMLQTEPFQK